jgi:hypothetical protein
MARLSDQNTRNKGYGKKQGNGDEIREQFSSIMGKKDNKDAKNTPDKNNRNPCIDQNLFERKPLTGIN